MPLKDAQGIAFTETGITISEPYYICINGYLSAKRGQFHIEYKNLLAVEAICRRSKKAMFIFLSVGMLFAMLVNGVQFLFGTLLGSQDMASMAKTSYKILGFFSIDTGGLDTIIAVFIGSVIFIIVLMLIFVFSSKAFIELTFIGGTIRVPCKSIRSADTKGLVSEIQRRKEQSRSIY